MKWSNLHFKNVNVINQTFIGIMKWFSYKMAVLWLCTNGANLLLACLIGLLACWTTSFDLLIVAPCIFELKKKKVVKTEKT